MFQRRSRVRVCRNFKTGRTRPSAEVLPHNPTILVLLTPRVPEGRGTGGGEYPYARFGILNGDKPQIGQILVKGIAYPDCNNVMPSAQIA
jgi:hypothetical protein